ncbi:putative tricarboxylic transport membrane protein [Tamaricihabitans halophyticus]|uniref:Putative tricarboxylic transport membrane protein n=1 Tax=Tamaricihabitans halophyticus TaxID=1262583 RepID=A0A4R2QX13_9PSEU|nr:tripartite tricarboxylate transporter permease [Tamaricihabitans halophyticus]TCP54257.1 putative tricarboxylic transport membrane protein [Tamaricihabitans halophyticus]
MDGLLYGLQVAFTLQNLLAAFAGTFAGTLIGVLPGLGPTAGAAILLPLTFTLDPVAALIMIAGIYYGSQYGGSTTAILLNIPGESSSVVTTFDGYKLTQKGRAGATLTIITIGSFISGTVAVVLVTLFGPPAASLALQFGAADFFALVVAGLVVLARVMGGRLSNGLIPLAIGLIAGTVGFDEISGAPRFTFGSTELAQGISVVAVAVGVFGLAELMRTVVNPGQAPTVRKVRIADLVPTKAEWRRSLAPWGRGGIIGFVLGLLPGAAPTMSTFVSYKVEKSVAKNRAEIGTGAIEGVAGPEAANNAAATAGIVPLLSLGIPFTAPLALMVAAMMIQGVTPGPLLVDQHPDVFWGVIASMYIGNVLLVILNLPLIGVWVRILMVPSGVLVAIIVVIALAGTYALNNSMLDVYVLLGAGVVGYFLNRTGFHLAPMAVGLILGPFAEKYFREGLTVAQGDLGYFVDSPFAIVLLAATALYLVVPALAGLVRRRRASAAASADRERVEQ